VSRIDKPQLDLERQHRISAFEFAYGPQRGRHIAGQLGHASTATTDKYFAKIAPVERIKAMREAGFTLD
jgi:hypothetical protein